MKRSIRSVSLLAVLLGFIWGCGSSHQQIVSQAPADPAPSAVSQPASNDAESVIAQARQHYFLGERELTLGHLEKARQEFDVSLDILMQYQATHEPDPRVESVIDELEDKIFEQEMASLRAGDGFTEHPVEPALIDELKNINTFPPADQQTKTEVEQELKSVTYDVPVEVNDKVLSFIRIFQNSRRKEFVGGLVRSGRYLDLMKKIFREEGLPEDLVYTALVESSFKSNAYSRARAKGFWQFISGTAKRYDLRMDWWVDERSDFEKSTRAAAGYLRDLYGMFGDWYLALGGYNAGENTILNGIRRTGVKNFWDLAETRYLRLETKNYVPAIIAAMIIAKDPQKYGFTEELDEPLQFDKVEIDYPVDLRLVAECTGATLEEIKLLNPELSRMTTPARSTPYQLRLPSNTTQTFLAEIAEIPESKRITWRKHEVKPGETLTSIAANYRLSAGSIASANSLSTDHVVSVGQRLVIPIGRTTTPVSYSAPKSSYANAPGTKKYHSVRSGDTLFRIAVRYGTSVEQLCRLNGISSRTTLRPGQSLIVQYSEPRVTSVPSGSDKKVIYQVKKGDTLHQIANLFRTDVASIMRWNSLGSRSAIYPGDRLTIYTK